jgi:hypothetical protein
MRFAVCVLLAAPLLAQAPSKIPSDLRFEVASFKPTVTAVPNSGIRPAPGGIHLEPVGVEPARAADDLLGLEPVGHLDHEPDRTVIRDISLAKAEKASTTEQLHVMLINLLADRLCAPTWSEAAPPVRALRSLASIRITRSPQDLCEPSSEAVMVVNEKDDRQSVLLLTRLGLTATEQHDGHSSTAVGLARYVLDTQI